MRSTQETTEAVPSGSVEAKLARPRVRTPDPEPRQLFAVKRSGGRGRRQTIIGWPSLTREEER